MAKADYMLSILWMLKQQRTTAAELADRLEISVRSVYRYIDALCASGVPVIADAGPGGGYSLPASFVDTPLFFDSGEQRALVQASAFARGSGYPYEAELDRAVAKLKLYNNSVQLEQLERHERGMETLQVPAAATALEPLLQELELCSAERVTLRMEYRKGNEVEASSRHINPYGLVLWKGQWYLAAFCQRRQEIRSFRVDRIAGLMRSGEFFVRPEGFSAREFLLQSLLPGRDKDAPLLAVTIASGESILNDLCSHWMFGHTLVERRAGQAVFLLDETSLMTYAAYFLLPYGKALQIVAPAALKQRLAEIAAGLAAHYGA